MTRRIIIGLIVIVALVAIIAYAGVGVVAYRALAVAQAECRLRGDEVNNTPADFAPFGDYEIDKSPYFMPDYEEVTFNPRGDDLNLVAYYVPAQGVTDPTTAPAVIVVHGVNDCKHRPTVLFPAGMLNRAGYNVMVIDLRNHGFSEADNGYFTGGVTEHLDVLGAYDWLIAERGIDPTRVGLLGTSLGAATVMIATGEEPAIAAVWADSGYADLMVAVRAELTRSRLPEFLSSSVVLMGQVLSGTRIDERSPIAAARQLDGRSALITHGDADVRLSVQYAYDLAAAISESGTPVEPLIFEGSDHILAMFDYPQQYEENLLAFFDKALRP